MRNSRATDGSMWKNAIDPKNLMSTGVPVVGDSDMTILFDFLKRSEYASIKARSTWFAIGDGTETWNCVFSHHD